MASSMATISSSSISLSRPLQVNRNRVCGLSSISFSIRTRSVSSLRLRQGASRFRVSCSAKPETLTKVCDIVRKQLALPPDSAVTGESKFAALGADSLDTVEIVMGLEEEFGISVEEETAQAIATVQDAADLIEKLMDNKVAG